jgi:CheY-like chemotaxis protein
MSYSTKLFPESGKASKPPTFFILLVDDNAMIRRILMRFISDHFKHTTLSAHEFHFAQAIHGDEALEAIKNKRLDKDHKHFHLIFMDINMRPNVPKDGLITTQKIRALEDQLINDDKLKSCEKAYIIRYSTDKPLPNAEELLEQGFDAMLNKNATTQIQVDEVLTEALKRYPDIQYHTPINRDNSPKPQK